MKAQINIRRITRIFSLIAILSLSTNLLFSQGLLLETASKLFSVHKNKVNETVNPVSFASFSTEKNAKNDSFNIRTVFNALGSTESYDNSKNNADVVILRSFQVSDLNFSIESNVNTEEWMTEPFSNNIEENIVTESWMTEPFTNDIEENINTESWMIEPIHNNFEEQITLENWMSEPIYEAALETNTEVEDWMTQPLSESFEEKIEVENWMTIIF